MKARDVMVSPVVTIGAQATVKDAAEVMIAKRISALPVVDAKGMLIGIISEGDLLHRAETDTERRRPWWLRAFTGSDTLAIDYIKSHATKVADVMTRHVVTAGPDTSLKEIAGLLETRAIKRVPIVDKGQIVGVVSRANLVQALASSGRNLEVAASDTDIRNRLLDHLKAQPWTSTALLNVTVDNGAVTLWGMVRSETERRALVVAAESLPGVRSVTDNMTAQPVMSGT